MHQDVEEKPLTLTDLRKQLDDKIQIVANPFKDKQVRREAAYEMADIYWKICEKQGNPDRGYDFSVSDVIFHWTHYDVCSNGYFYRMS